MQNVTFSNLKPGDMYGPLRKWVVLHNAGSLDIGHLTVQAINVNDPNGLLGQIHVSVNGWVGNPYDSYFTPGWNTTNGQPVNSWLTSSPEDILSIGAIQYHNGGMPPSTIAPNSDDTIILDFSVPSTMDDTYQGKTASFDLLFHAEQVH
jgi:hypothetical protein